jgi:hypothetical protein
MPSLAMDSTMHQQRQVELAGLSRLGRSDCWQGQVAGLQQGFAVFRCYCLEQT